MTALSKNSERDGHDCRKDSNLANVMITIAKNMQILPT